MESFSALYSIRRLNHNAIIALPCPQNIIIPEIYHQAISIETSEGPADCDIVSVLPGTLEINAEPLCHKLHIFHRDIFQIDLSTTGTYYARSFDCVGKPRLAFRAEDTFSFIHYLHCTTAENIHELVIPYNFNNEFSFDGDIDLTLSTRKMDKTITASCSKEGQIKFRGVEWTEFVTDHDLDEGMFVVFRWNHFNSFGVYIFSANGREVNYCTNETQLISDPYHPNLLGNGHPIPAQIIGVPW